MIKGTNLIRYADGTKKNFLNAPVGGGYLYRAIVSPRVAELLRGTGYPRPIRFNSDALEALLLSYFTVDIGEPQKRICRSDFPVDIYNVSIKVKFGTPRIRSVTFNTLGFVNRPSHMLLEALRLQDFSREPINTTGEWSLGYAFRVSDPAAIRYQLQDIQHDTIKWLLDEPVAFLAKVIRIDNWLRLTRLAR